MQNPSVLFILYILNLFVFHTISVLSKNKRDSHHHGTAVTGLIKELTIPPSTFYKGRCKNVRNILLKECECFGGAQMYCENKKYCANCDWSEMPVCKNSTTNKMRHAICPQHSESSK
ncbi:hypothetical protein ILUMI_05475 [Ignelater luminosus]|uniref:Uncharacterized protein n=1 Tax=Ignelater luminosus TaxID=2038154 RepID=A0A8K0DCW4_IGNLU|nr:hypothetical protein ILUMI_05475 [Ignelater luminosus]